MDTKKLGKDCNGLALKNADRTQIKIESLFNLRMADMARTMHNNKYKA